MHAPIHGSIINPPAKLYKRFTPTETIALDDRTIVFQNNYYRTYASIRWVEATEKQEGDSQPISGLITEEGYITIKCNGKYNPAPNDRKEPMHEDILGIGNEFWMIEQVQRVRIKGLKNFAVIYMSLRKLL